jgi:hypothetical protein
MTYTREDIVRACGERLDEIGKARGIMRMRMRSHGSGYPAESWRETDDAYRHRILVDLDTARQGRAPIVFKPNSFECVDEKTGPVTHKPLPMMYGDGVDEFLKPAPSITDKPVTAFTWDRALSSEEAHDVHAQLVPMLSPVKPFDRDEYYGRKRSQRDTIATMSALQDLCRPYVKRASEPRR